MICHAESTIAAMVTTIAVVIAFFKTRVKLIFIVLFSVAVLLPEWRFVLFDTKEPLDCTWGK